MKSLMLTGVLSSTVSGSYTAAATLILLAMLFCSLLLMGRDFTLFRSTGERIYRTNTLLWAAGAAMALFTLLFILFRSPWLLAVVPVVGSVVVYRSVGNGIRDQLRNY